MYPTSETMNRCVVMQHLETEQLKKLNNMWDSVKVGYLPYSTMLIIVIISILVIGGTITFITLRKKGFSLLHRKSNFGTLVKSERIK